MGLKKPAAETDDFVAKYRVQKDGELHFAANDLAHWIGLIDKYDNNQGWVWVHVERTS